MATASAQTFPNAHSQHGKDLSCGKFVSWKSVQQRLHQLAEEDSILDQRLLQVSAAIHFVHDVLQMDPQATQSAYSSPTGDHMQITMTPGKLLAELILQRLAITMNHQLAHRTAQHSAEAKSRALLVAFAAFSRPHFSSVMPYTAALATAAIALCTHKFSVVAWLRQVRELRQMRFEQQSA